MTAEAPNARASASPVPIASEPPGSPPTSAPVQVAKSASGGTGKAILDPDTAEKAGDGETAQRERPSFSWVLIAAGVLLAVAGGAATLVVWLLLRRRRT